MDSDKKLYAKNQEKEKNQHIQVYVRVRPINQTEQKQGAVNLVNVITERREIVVKEKLNASIRTFTFDKVFGPNSKQADVYEEVVVPIMEEVLMGYNCTIFAYGQTGTGKTFTMEGERSFDGNFSWENDPLSGIIPRTLHHLFERLTDQHAEFTVRVSFVELYNEELFDLLTGIEDSKRLRLFDDPVRKGSVVIHGLEDIIVRSKDEVYDIMERGSRKRQTAATLLNAQSSRSHSVFSITVHIREMTMDGEELLKTGKLYLVDLAGSENIGRSGAVDKRAREAGNINQSLLTLGRVITSLVEHAPHVPYRESKLTRLLQDSLGGKTKTSIIATISPASTGIEETLSTLDYAFRAKNITNRPEVNQKLTKKAILKEYSEEIERLRRDLQATREKHGIYLAEENYVAMQKHMASQSDEISELSIKIEMIQQEYNKLNDMFTESQQNYQETAERLAMTKDKYLQTRNVLCETSKQLFDTMNTVDEKEVLLEAQMEKEKQLRSQAETLVDISKRATSHLSHLHTKLEKKEVVENKNLMTLHQFHNFIGGQVSNLNNNVEKFINALTTSNTKRMAENETTINKNINDSESTLITLDSFQRDFESSRSALSKNLVDQFKARHAAYNVESHKIGEITSAVVKEVETYYKTQITNFLSKAAQASSKFNDSIDSLKSLIVNENAERLESMANFETQMNVCFNKFNETLTESFVHRESTAVAIRQTACDSSKRQRLIAGKMKQARDLIDSISQDQLLIDQGFQRLQEISEQQSERENLISDFMNGHVKESSLKCDEIKELTRNKCETQNRETQSLFRSIDKVHTSDQQARQDFQEKSEQFIASFKQNVEQQRNEMATNVKQACQLDEEASAANDAILVKMATSNSCTMKHISVSFKRKADDAVVCIKEEQAARNAILDDIKVWCTNQQQVNEDLLKNADALFVEKIARYNPTGETPARQHFNIPTELVRASPHENVLKRFRKDNPPLEWGGFSDDEIENLDTD